MASANNSPSSLPSFQSTRNRDDNRRAAAPSYANVAAGMNPSRFNTLAAFGGAQQGGPAGGPGASSTSLPQSHSPPMSRQRSRSSLRSMEIDGQGAGWKRPASSWSNEISRYDQGRMGCLQHEEHLPFFTPSYLRQSRHVQKLQRQWEEHVQELQDSAIQGHQHHRQPSLSTSSSSANLNKAFERHVHRGPVQDVIERIPPPIDHGDGLRQLPTRWNEDDKAPGLEILNEGCEVRFNGVTKQQQDEAASVRADHPMPREVGLYYFEVTVLSRSKDGLIGIGFSGLKVPLIRLPGWESESWAYHGDDGYSFGGQSTGKAYGPKFSATDVVGCGVNFRTGEAFFTLNGNHLGTAFTNIKSDRLYPSIGMKKPGEHLRTNFGRQPFVFNIDELMAKERLAIQNEISSLDLRSLELHPPDDESNLIRKLVGQYLAHEGYVETAKTFARDVHDQQASLSSEGQDFKVPDSEEDVHAANRQKIRRSILDGDIDKALKYTNAFYPRVLEDDRNKDIHFRLRCRKFIEMMRRYTELSAASSPVTVTKGDVGSNGHVDNGEASADEDEDEEADGEEPVSTQMELDDQLNREASNSIKSLDQTQNDSPVDDTEMSDLPPKASLMKQTDLLTAALAYGRELQATFGSDSRQKVKKQLSDIFAIMAYVNPSESVVGGLLDPRGRVQIAEEVNGAILVSLGKPPSAAIEKLCAQTEALLDDTVIKGGGAAAFVNVQQDFLRP